VRRLRKIPKPGEEGKKSSQKKQKGGEKELNDIGVVREKLEK